MNIFILTFAALVLIFSFVIFFGAPYLPTLKPEAQKALGLLDLKPGQTLLELGSGDGRVLKQAAKQGIRGIGYELNPLLVIYSQISCWRYRKLVTFKCRNFWQVKHIAKLIKWIRLLFKKFSHHVLPASIQTIGYLVMMLPFCSQSFLKEFWVFKALTILKFINADNKVQLFLFF